MSELIPAGTAKWFWTDDLARALVDAGHATDPVLEGWMSTPIAIRSEGDALAVAEALLVDEAGSSAA